MKRILKFFLACIGVFVLIIVVSIVIYFSTKPSEEVQNFADSYFIVHPVNLTGMVVNKLDGDHDYGMVMLNVIKSNSNYYDPFKLNEPCFFYYLKNKYAEVYCTGIEDFYKGDSVVIESSKKTFDRYRNGHLEYSYNLHVIAYGNYYDWIKGHHKENN